MNHPVVLILVSPRVNRRPPAGPTVPPAEGARARGDAEGGGVAQDGRRRRVRRRQVRALPEVPLGSPGKAHHLHSSQGKRGEG